MDQISDLVDAIAIISFIQEDASAISAQQKGKQEQSCLSDNELAFEILLNDLQETERSVNDRRLADSISKAVDSDKAAIARLVDDEKRARAERAEALSTTGRPTNHEGRNQLHTSSTSSAPQHSPIYQEYPKTTERNGNEEEAADAKPSSSYKQRQERAEAHHAPKTICNACTDHYPSDHTIKAPCSHSYCHGCIRSLFIHSITDESLYPPRCCGQHIPFDTVYSLLSDQEVESFRQSVVEYTTSDRIYCPTADCGKFIPPANIRGENATCGVCSRRACVHCKAAEHDGDCAEDELLQMVLHTASEEGWQRCFRCRAMVELDYGCNHMTCKCRAEFCYLCGVEWKMCECAQWDEGNLLRCAEQLVDRVVVAGEPVVATEDRAYRVRGMVEELRDRHDCRHLGRWIKVERNCGYRRHPFTCEICNAHFFKFILQCRHCQLQACQTCRGHRI
ncbi:hypothetical protein K440DRAFT_599895 [Wilcoxina mikolae CBS 423.85]|nr:hypothetical protein K440DRAFT_599895 [Wilcoxina mikolae CBS 423.85]